MSGRRAVGTALLAVGYPPAIVVLTRLVPVLRQRRVWWFLSLEGATACIVAGWVVRGDRRGGVIINALALLGFAVAWVVTGRRSRRG